MYCIPVLQDDYREVIGRAKRDHGMWDDYRNVGGRECQEHSFEAGQRREQLPGMPEPSKNRCCKGCAYAGSGVHEIC